MTTNDYNARLARLQDAGEGDTVTVPADWKKPNDVTLEISNLLRDIDAGDSFVHDGSGDELPWFNDDHGFTYSTDLASLGLDVDQADETDDDSITADPDEDDKKTTVGHVHVRVVPDTDGFVEKIAKVAGEAADAIDAAGFHLDEFQRERVAALEQAVRILESRRSPRTGSGGGVLSSLFAPGTSVPMVGVQDMVDIAAFIADADTGRAEVQA